MLKLQGEKIYLRPLEIDDANGNYPNWFNDPVVCKYNSHGDRLYTKQMAIDYINMVKESKTYKVSIFLYDLTNGLAKMFSPMFLGK